MTDGLLARARADLRLNWRAALAFHLLVQLIGFAIFTPLATWVGRRLVLAAGEPVISNFDMAGFVLSPTGAAFVLVIAALTIASAAGGVHRPQLASPGTRLHGDAVTAVSTIGFVLRRLPRLLRLVDARVPAAAAARPALRRGGGHRLAHDAAAGTTSTTTSPSIRRSGGARC